MSKPDRIDRIRFILTKKWIVSLFILVGIILTLLSVFLNSKSAPEIWVSITSALAGSLFAVGLVDFIISFSTVNEYINKMVNCMHEVEYLEKLDSQELEKLRNNVIAVILKKNNIDDLFLLETEKKTLQDLVSKDYYIDSHEIEVYFSFNTDKSFICKTIITRANYIKTKKGSVSIRPIRSKIMIDISGQEIYKVKECAVNKKRYEIKTTHENISSGVYNTRYTNAFVHEINENEHTAYVEYTVELLLPLSDQKTTFVLDCLCKKMRVDYYFLPSGDRKVTLSGNAFCADAKRKVARRYPHENHFQIEVEGSMLRGEGIALYYQPVV
jgi:hypothetical protein